MLSNRTGSKAETLAATPQTSRSSENGSPTVVELLISAIQLPLFVAGPGTKRQVGSERGDEVYVVDLARYTCTCHSFRKGRATFAETDIRRCCRHISRLLLYEKRTGKLSDFLHVMLVNRLNYGRGIWVDAVQHPMRYFQIGGDDVLLVKGDSAGVDVFAAKQATNGHGFFGYNFDKVRWSDLGMPKHHQRISELIHQWVESGKLRAPHNADLRAMSEARPRVE